ncbi:hypothetical protein Tco_0223637 [Tanacetum coccineum]
MAIFFPKFFHTRVISSSSLRLKDSPVNVFNGDMTLDTLLNDNPTRIRSYPKEFLVLIGLSRMWYAPRVRPAFYDDETKQEMRLQNFIKVINPFDITCGEEKLEENESPLLERTVDVVTQPSDQVVNLASVPVEQEIQITTLPPLVSVARKSASIDTLAGESASKNKKGSTGSSSERTSTGESASKGKKTTTGFSQGRLQRQYHLMFLLFTPLLPLRPEVCSCFYLCPAKMFC